MKFSIITPSYRRPAKLLRAIESVVNQRCADWEMIIINDSPDAPGYNEVTDRIANEDRIKFLVNEINLGVNASRNRALDIATGDWVIFLDDDDYLAADTLNTLACLIIKFPTEEWIVTNRTTSDRSLSTSAPTSLKLYQYASDYLILRRIRGDATHCINRKQLDDIRFSKTVRQGEEWIFYFGLGLRSGLFYINEDTTLSDGYDVQLGLNFRRASRRSRLNDIMKLTQEGWYRGYFKTPTFLVYLLLRLARILTKT